MNREHMEDLDTMNFDSMKSRILNDLKEFDSECNPSNDDVKKVIRSMWLAYAKAVSDLAVSGSL